jgi:hypothetical protein
MGAIVESPICCKGVESATGPKFLAPGFFVPARPGPALESTRPRAAPGSQRHKSAGQAKRSSIA